MRRPIPSFGACAGVLAGLLAFAVSPALAAESGPQWTVASVSRPTNFAPTGDKTGDAYVVTVTNTGGAATNGTPVTVTDELPPGLSLDPAGASGEDELVASHGEQGAKLVCVFGSCTYTGVVVPDDTLVLSFPVDVSADAPSSVSNVVRVSGGGAPGAAMQTPTAISEDHAAFGISPGGASTVLSSMQAGAHPDLTTSIAFNTVSRKGALAGAPKDTTDDLPPGFALDLPDTPACPAAVFLEHECGIDTQVGVTTVTLLILSGAVGSTLIEPVYNLAPGPGEAAKIGFSVAEEYYFEGDISVRPGDYGGRAIFHNITEGVPQLDSVSLTLWGVPAAPIHDPLRWKVDEPGSPVGHFGVSSDAQPAPFFTNPTVCGTGPLEARFSVTSWEHPNPEESPASTPMLFGPMVGCDRLGMEPSLTAEATTSSAYAPSGLDLDTIVPQTYENAGGLATSALKGAVVTLPEGMTVNPSAGAGLEACSEAEYEEEGVAFVAGRGCPSESKLGTVKIVTPALKEEIAGSVFLAEPAPFGEMGKNPFGSLIALYIVARLPDRGVLVKAAGEVQANALTGQLVTTFDTSNVSAPHAGLPPLPFSLLTFRFNQGATSPLVTPPTCGSYEVKAALTPWSAPEGATPLTPLIPPFPISSNCPAGGVAPFAPQVIAGTQDNSAGSYSPLYLRIVRNDGEQEITGFSSQLPQGLTANLSGVPFCSEAAIALARTKTGAQEEAEPSCPVASQIGHLLAGAGVGSILAEARGKIYMAGPFEGAPFSIAAITAAKVGPFDLGTVVVHLPLLIDPETAAVSIPAGAADQIPHIIKGIVIHVRDIRVYIDKQNFTLNPTNCNAMSFGAGVIGSGQSFTNPADDVAVAVRDPFQAANCQSLKFAPKFSVSTAGRTSKANGASLSVRLSYPTGSLGQDANIKEVKVDLPKQLPSRLTTLQKACTEAQFNANPASCPAASIIGHAAAITPILPVPLTGPAYFVSHGGAKFPELIIVLQGYGVTIELHGETFISKAGITSSTFRTVPDQPVTNFELTLPQGPDSALAANGNLCASKLVLPTEFTAQNGMVIHQSTPVGITGCPKAKALTRAQKLAVAMRACRRDRSKAKRATCEKSARKQYRPVRAKKKKK